MRTRNYLWSMLAFVMAGLLSVGLSSCKDDDDKPVLSVTGDLNVSLTAEGTEVEADITIIAENTGWDIESGASWLKVAKAQNTVAVSADKNTSTTERKGRITISATKDPKQIFTLYVTQEGEKPYVLVNGIDSNNMEFEGTFNGKSGVDYKQTITVTSNVSWSASGIPSWLNVNPSNGSGTVSMTIYPTSENTSSVDRTATITLSGNGATAQIEVTQKNSLSSVKVTPTNLVALYNQIACDLKASGSVNKFHWLCVSENEMNRLTDNELLQALLNEEANKYADDYLLFPAYDSNGRSIAENTTYYFCTVAFDVDDNRGEVVKSKVTTPAYKDATNDAWVSFPNDDLLYGSTGFQFTAVKEGFCDTYHLIYGNLPSDYTYPPVLFAFEINYYNKNKKKHWFAENWELDIVTNYPNNHTFTYSTSLLEYFPLISIFARGVFRDGTESSDMTGGQWDVSESESPRKVSKPKTLKENLILRRSVEQARARKFFRK